MLTFPHPFVCVCVCVCVCACREVQLHKLQAPPSSQPWLVHFSNLLQSSFLLPLLTVLLVISLLLCCRHHHWRHYSSVPTSPTCNLPHRSQSVNSLLDVMKIHRRYPSGSTLHKSFVEATTPSELTSISHSWHHSRSKFTV